MVLLGRRREREVLDQLIDGARAGRSGVLVVRAEAGVGKTALLKDAIESAPDLTVVRAVGVESEMELAFAALHQLCAPVLDRLERLPGPQRDALAITFGLSDGEVPDRFLVALAVLSLVAEVAEDGPLVCVVDDAQWLDQASAQALAFVARRLLADSVVMLFAAREPVEALVGLPELVVEGLPEDDARELLRSVFPGRLDERIRQQVVAETRGNPLALLELTRGLSPAQVAGGFGLPGALSLQGRIEERFMARLETLPEDSRRLLLVAAAEPTGDPAPLWRAAHRLGISGPALEPASAAGLIEVGVRLRFRHPLVRSAIYQAASPEERRRVHGALAEAIDAQTDPDRRAWHLAEAAAGPDEDVAAELERAASRAQGRGGLAAAAAFLGRAVALTPDPARRAERALAAVQTKYEGGMLDDSLALLATVDADALNDLQRARISLLRAQIAFASRRGSDAPPLLLDAAKRLEPQDVGLARRTYLEALSAALFAGRLARSTDVVEVSEAVRAVPPPEGPATSSDLLLHGLAIRFTVGYPAGARVLKNALRGFRDEAILPPHEARWLWLASWVAADLWDDETLAVLSTRELDLLRDAGALMAIPLALSTRSIIQAMSGELAAAASLADEIRVVTEATRIQAPPYSAILLAVCRGREAEALELIETAVGEATGRGEGSTLAFGEFARAVLYNGLGRHEAALAAVGEVAEHTCDMGVSTWALAELMEAAVRCGKLRLAESALARLAETTRASGTEWALGVEARSRALLSDGDAGESLYREAIDRLRRTRVRLELARAHLLYGEWLRRDRRRADAREQLRIAYEMFAAMGVEAFAGRAERELLASGQQVRKRFVETRAELTAQEAQIARLAGHGVSNAEIAARLFISRRTVEYHLSKVFTKLGISSRHELDRVLPPEPTAAMAS